MDQSEINIYDLLTGYCSAKISDEDLQVLQAWMEESDENRVEANEILKIYRNYRAYEAMDEIDMEKALGNMISVVTERKRRRRLVNLRSAAAVALLVLGSVFVLDRLNNNSEAIIDQEVAQVIEPGEPKATLILGDGTRINLEEIGDSTLQTSDGIDIEKQKETLDYQQAEAEVEVLNTIQIPRGGEYTLVLSDGSKVWLNSESALTYPVKFLGETRTVALSGEAYFEVAENSEIPFLVNTAGTSVEVLGTAFNVKSYKDEDQVETTLVTGKVKFYYKDQESEAVVLQPGMQGVAAEGSSEIAVAEVDTRLYTSWKDGIFVFEHLTLSEIMVTLGRWYDVKAEFENSYLRSLHFTGDLERYETINTHLEMIELTTNAVKFEINDHTVFVKSNYSSR